MKFRVLFFGQERTLSCAGVSRTCVSLAWCAWLGHICSTPMLRQSDFCQERAMYEGSNEWEILYATDMAHIGTVALAQGLNLWYLVPRDIQGPGKYIRHRKVRRFEIVKDKFKTLFRFVLGKRYDVSRAARGVQSAACLGICRVARTRMTTRKPPRSGRKNGAAGTRSSRIWLNRMSLGGFIYIRFLWGTSVSYSFEV